LDNRIGTGGGKGKKETATLHSDDPVRYILIMFDKIGTDSWCSSQHISHPNPEQCTPVSGAERYCPYTNGAIYLSEIALYGEEREDPTTNFIYTDAATGITLEAVTLLKEEINSCKVTKKALTAVQSNELIEMEMKAPYGLYDVEFFLSGGRKITDMSGRTVKVTIPWELGSAILSYYSMLDGILIPPAYASDETDTAWFTYIDGTFPSNVMVLFDDNGSQGADDSYGDDDSALDGTGLVLGRLYNETGRSIGFENLTLGSPPLSIYTDGDGSFMFENVPEGMHTLCLVQEDGTVFEASRQIPVAANSTVTLTLCFDGVTLGITDMYIEGTDEYGDYVGNMNTGDHICVILPLCTVLISASAAFVLKKKRLSVIIIKR